MHAIIRLMSALVGACVGLAVVVCLTMLVVVPVVAIVNERAGAAGMAIGLMLWLALALAGMATGLGGKVGYHLARRWLGPLDGVPVALMCPGCGYNLRGSISATCPECGRAIDPAQLPHITATR